MAPCSTARGPRFWRTSLLLLVAVGSWQLSAAARGAPRRGRYPSRRFLQSDDSISSYYGAHENYNTAEYGQEVGETDFHGDHDDSVEIEFEDDDHNEQEELTGASLSEESPDDGDEDGDDHQANVIAQLTALTHGDKPPRSKHKGRSVVPPVTIAVPYPVPVERKVPVFIETKVPVYVEKKVEVPVQYQVPVYHREVIHVPKPVVFNVDRPYPVYVPRTVFKYAPVKVRIRSRTRY